MLNPLFAGPQVTAGIIPSLFHPLSYFSLALFGFLVSGFLYWRFAVRKQVYVPHRRLLECFRLAFFISLILVFYILGARFWTPSIYFVRYFYYALFIAFGIFIALFLLPGKRGLSTGEEKEAERFAITLIRWSFSLGLISLIFFVVRIFPLLLPRLGFPIAVEGESPGGVAGWCSKIVVVMSEWLKFTGPNIEGFNRYLADPLYVYFVLANAYVLHVYIRPDPDRDKYWHLLRSFFSFVSWGRSEPGKRVFWSGASKIAVLSLGVKIFFGPLLFTWAVGGLEHQRHLVETFEWNYERVIGFLIALFLFIDVTIFAFGYFVELPQFKNEIQSVDGTLLGWVVCLMCYPPFSVFSFKPFDVPLFQDYQPLGSAAQTIVQGCLPILWLIYVWATVVLGAKSSNLTNRGIVVRGPYAFVRHPAYAAKVLLWALGAIAFADRTFFTIISLVVVYSLRAWTEERHLSQDPDYREYKGRVRSMFIPGII